MLRSLITAFALLGFAHAQSGLESSLVFTGTTTTSGAETFSWLVWQPTDPLFISSKTVAMYRKAGGPASAVNYQRISIVEPVVDTRLIASLLPVSEKMGQNLAELDQLLTEMFQDAFPAPQITTAEKISAVLTGAHGNAANMERVILLGRQHPAIALCGGFAVADLIPSSGLRTYELREFDKATNTDIGVLGRVTVDPSSVLVLPAPGTPVEVEDASPKGNLNVSMRWSTPNALRDLSPLQYGYDVYRLTASAVTSMNWHVTAPSSVQDLINQGAQKVNRLAVLPPVLLTETQSLDLNIPTVFLNDDKERYTGGFGFSDGQEWGYFAVARDLLGRGGLPSIGKIMQLHDRLPTNPPQNVNVRNKAIYNGTVRDQRLEITWDPPSLPPFGSEVVTSYYLYRWRSPMHVAQHADELDPINHLPERNLIAVLPFWQTTFRDDATPPPPTWAVVDEPAPSTVDDLGKTYYYTVRAMDGAVSGNLSGNSAPAWGVLRDREGPDGVGGGLRLFCGYPTVDFTDFTQLPLTGLTDDQAHLLFVCTATEPGLDWAEFQISGSGATRIDMGRAYFAKVGPIWTAALRKTLLTSSGDKTMWCRVATKNGVVSDYEITGQNSPDPEEDKYLRIRWSAAVNNGPATGNDCGWRHEVVDLGTGGTNDVQGTFTPTLDVKEWKVYRRVNNSKQTLIASGENNGTAPITWTDPSPPASNAIVCYFLQFFDEHGNAGELVQQGECIESGSSEFIPTPMLEPLTGTTPLNPRMRVSWFCSLPGVERFEVWVARDSGNAPGSTGSGLSSDLATLHPNELSLKPEVSGLDFSVFETGLARHLSPTGEPHFSFTLPVSNSDTYTVMIRAVGKGQFGARSVGKFSNPETFQFALRTLGLSTPVPWPDRPLPPKADFHPGITAINIGNDELGPWRGNAIRIGEYRDSGSGTGRFTTDNDNPALLKYFIVPTHRDIEDYLYTNDSVAQQEPKELRPGLILPVALYRVQVPNSNYPSVPGDIVQVSPLMEKIAQIEGSGPATTTVTDPFIAILPRTLTGLPNTISLTDQDVFLLDRQPVILGARYKYFLVRFSPTREIERVIVTNEVTANELAPGP